MKVWKSTNNIQVTFQCPKSFVEEYLIWVIVAVVVLFLAVLAAGSGIYFSIKTRRQEIERLNQLWQIPFIHLHQINVGRSDYSFRDLSFSVKTKRKRRAQCSKSSKWN